jgi:hypothetical protein
LVPSKKAELPSRLTPKPRRLSSKNISPRYRHFGPHVNFDFGPHVNFELFQKGLLPSKCVPQKNKENDR